MWLRLYQKVWQFEPGAYGDFYNYRRLQFVQCDSTTGDYKVGLK